MATNETKQRERRERRERLIQREREYHEQRKQREKRNSIPRPIAEFPAAKLRVAINEAGRIYITRTINNTWYEYLTPRMLNAKPDKLVHSAITKQLKKYFVPGGNNFYDGFFVPGYDNVPAELPEQLYVQLRYAEELAEKAVITDLDFLF